jgi:tetratricopeptide (TPR) repeat protein
MRQSARITATSHRLLLVAEVLALSLITAELCRSRAGEPAGDIRVGQRVVPRQRDPKLRDTVEGPEHLAEIDIYRVEEINGGSLRLMPSHGASGWADAAQVVPVDQAVEFFGDAMGKLPGNPYNYAIRAWVLLLQQQDPVQVHWDCDEAIRLDPKFAFARYVRGVAWANSSCIDKAIDDFNEAIRLAPWNPYSYRERGGLRGMKRDFDGAIADFSEVIRLDPQDAASFLDRAALWAFKNQIDKALADIDASIRLDPNRADAYVVRGSLLAQQGKSDQAVADFNQNIKLKPQEPSAYVSRGSVWHMKKEYDRAIADYNRAIHLDEKNAQAYFLRGVSYCSLRRYDAAIADLDRATQLDPAIAEVYAARGTAWAEKREFGRAIAEFTQIIYRFPTNRWQVWAHCRRGLVEAENQQYDLAVADLRQAVELGPDSSCALNGCAWFRATCPVAKYRDGAQALAAATKACELTGHKEPGLLDTLAAACAESGDFDSAIKWQVKAIELKTDAREKTEYGARLKLYREKKPFREVKP